MSVLNPVLSRIFVRTSHISKALVGIKGLTLYADAIGSITQRIPMNK